MVPGLPPMPAGHHVTRAYRVAVMLTATCSLALNYTAWSLVRPIGQDPWHFMDVGWRTEALMISVPVVLGSLGRIPVGALTDRFGPRITFPAVGVAAAVAVLVLATANSRPVALAAACALGVAGTAFPIGASLVSSLYPLGRRGFAFSLFGAGTGGAAAGSLASLRAAHDYSTGELLILAVALLGCAVLAAVVIRVGPAARSRREYPLRSAAALIRLPATRYLAAWYALTAGGMVSFSLYLPSYLHDAYHLGWNPALLITAAAVAVAAAACPVGGWYCDRHSPAGMLAACYGTVAALALVVVFEPPKDITMAFILGIAAGFGTASGVILALLGRTAPTGGAGIIAGTVGAAGGLAALLGPMLLGAAYQRTGSYSIGWTLLAGLALATAAHVRGQQGSIGAALAFPTPADRHATNVVSLTATDAARNTEGIVAVLAALATPGDLVIVYGHPATPDTGMTPFALVNGLRAHLPGRTVVAVYIDSQLVAVESSLIAEVLDEGQVVLVYTPEADLGALATRMADRLGAHQVLRLTDHGIDGSRPLSLPWLIPPLVTAGRGDPRIGNGTHPNGGSSA